MGQDHIVKGIFWLVPVIFGAGGVYANISSAQEKVATVEKRLENVESKFEIHDKMPAHPVTAKEIKTIKRQQREILVEQRNLSRNLPSHWRKLPIITPIHVIARLFTSPTSTHVYCV